MVGEETTVSPVPVVRSAGTENSRRYSSGNPVSFLLKGKDTGGRFTLVELTECRESPPDRHVHHREDEILYVLEGEITVEVDGEVHRAPTGTLAFLPRGIEHGFVVESERAKMLVMSLPAGLEGYFEEVSRPAKSLARIAAKYGIEITGPPVEPDKKKEVNSDEK
jgi:quercetin dioxygenase-like cupin family protein